ncbi:hypothetical protein DFJ67_5965 [Asanoa ferruginea]|uniref:Uncharacterized protein n=2 Tax=Asanoa ferruginea TaxID=53367 RepID=A0A3D9ZSP6_9ACTN|nr:hypothetical protein DFJ67_5965 [Asanoa ferruginea]
MPVFKVRDLMINLLPEGGGPLPRCPGVSLPNCAANSCFNVSVIGCGVTCPAITRCTHGTLIADTCPASSCYNYTCEVTNFSRGCGQGYTCLMPGEGIGQAEDLTLLKQQLRLALEQVEAQEAARDEAERPQTIEEVDQLTERLNDALDELRRRRVELSERPADGD